MLSVGTVVEMKEGWPNPGNVIWWRWRRQFRYH